MDQRPPSQKHYGIKPGEEFDLDQGSCQRQENNQGYGRSD
jgi:hypothetical protein